MDWQTISVAADETHHLYNHSPLYHKRYIRVLKYHAPGLAPVYDDVGAYHIDIEGEPLYTKRYRQTFGYYAGLAAVESSQGWFHIDTRGESIYTDLYAWCGNFQEGQCVVKNQATGFYYHINSYGQRIYPSDYSYVGDYREGSAVVCAQNGLHTHIDKQGNYLHGQWFLGLDVFHKGIARARDENGWFHVNKTGQPLYSKRYKNVESYYNHVAHVEDLNGALLTIDLNGNTLSVIRPGNSSLLQELSADCVGFWKTQTIYTAVQLGLFDCLPNTITNISAMTKIQDKNCRRLLRALAELNLVQQQRDDYWQLIPKGMLLKRHPSNSTMADAAIIWGHSHYQQWTRLQEQLMQPQFTATDYFNKLAQDQVLLPIYQHALSGYAENDYQAVVKLIDWSQHKLVIDAGGGTGTLLHKILASHPHLQGILLELPSVIKLIKPQSRCRYYSIDILQNWSYQADAIFLARVLHDWSDEHASMILKQASKSLVANGKIYILEMVLETNSVQGGLLDLNMLVMTGGSERTLVQWQVLASLAKLKISEICSLNPIVSLLILEPNDN